MQIRNRTFFISEHVSDHYRRLFASEITLRSGRMTVSADDNADYVIYDASESMEIPHSCVKLTVNEMVGILDSVPRTVNDAFLVISGVLVRWIPEESEGSFLTIPSGVTRIAPGAFRPVYPCQKAVFRKAMKQVRRIIFPKTLEVIEKDTFRGFSNLETIRLKEGIRELGGFRGCAHLDEITIPKSCTKIGEYAFAGCRQLSHLQWSENLCEIGKGAFAGCAMLSEVTLKGHAVRCEKGAFRGTGVKKLTIEADSCFLDSHCFSSCNVEEINVISGKTEITPYTFPSSFITAALEKMKSGNCHESEYEMWADMMKRYGKTFIESLPPLEYLAFGGFCASIAGLENDQVSEQTAVRKEAVIRLKTLIRNPGLNPCVLKYFRQNKLYYSYLTAQGFIGSVDTISYEPRYEEIIEEAERLYGIHVYHAIETYGFGRELILLYVEQDYRDWQYGRPENGTVMAYVYNLDSGEDEFGCVKLDSYMGALLRAG